MAENIERLERKLDLLIRVVATRCIDGKGTNESIRILGRLGVGREEIATICDTTPNTVSVRLSEARKRKGSRAKEKVNG